jgi:hypothetical protein
MDITLALIGIAWAAILVMLAAGLVASVAGVVGPREELPFFVRLERRGLNALQLEAAVGAGGIARALRRCSRCPARADCEHRTLECPNDALFAYVKRLAA